MNTSKTLSSMKGQKSKTELQKKRDMMRGNDWDNKTFTGRGDKTKGQRKADVKQARSNKRFKQELDQEA